MKKTVLVALLGTAFALPLAAQAEGPYAGFNVGRAESKIDGVNQEFKNRDTAFKVYGGYGFTKNFGAEAGYVRLADFDLPLNTGTTTNVKPGAFYVAGTATFPINEQFSLFGKLGVTANRTKGGDKEFTNTSALVGFGGAYNFTKNIALVGEYENFGRFSDDPDFTSKADMVSLGVRYTF